MFNYRLIKPIDTILTRTILESCIYGVVYCVLLGLIWLVGDRYDLSHGILIIAILSLVVVLAFGCGLILMVLGHHFHDLEKVISLLRLPMYAFSGVMFSFQNLPDQALGYFSWNPLFHAVELERAALFPTYDSQPASLMYLAEVALTILTLGLFVYKGFEKKMLRS
ncbi:ABC transporter permease [Undibacterium arcticum]|uniref:ABC transporter permease n=1 Tax=Undibacterium arcticum TaxID=1762892 RepID=UPI00361E90D8